MAFFKQLPAQVRNLLKNTSGTVAVEYGVIITAMFLALIPGFLYVSTGIMVKFIEMKDYFWNF